MRLIDKKFWEKSYDGKVPTLLSSEPLFRESIEIRRWGRRARLNLRDLARCGNKKPIRMVYLCCLPTPPSDFRGPRIKNFINFYGLISIFFAD